MFDFISNILQFGLNLVSNLGYWGVFIVTILENLIPPIPSEVILPFTGFLVFKGEMMFWLVVLAATLGNLVGALFFYYVGAYGGRWFLIKYGRYLGFKEQDIDRGDVWFDKHGKAVVLFGRMVPIVRSVISIPAGISKMPLIQFISYSLIGSAIWNIALVYFGFVAGEHWPTVSEYFKEYETAVEILLAILLAWYIVKRLRRK